MSDHCSAALVGTGVFAHNVHKVLEGGGCRVELFVDEIRTGRYQGRPVVKAADLAAGTIAGVDKFVVAISHRTHRQAAVARLKNQGVPPEKIIPLTDDHIIPILGLVFGKFGARAAGFFGSPECRSVLDLERHFFGDGWKRAVADLDPGKPTVAFCFYGRGGGFRRHLRGLIPLLADRFNLLAFLDEELPGEGFAIPELYMGPDTACEPQRAGLPEADLYLTAHFIPCSPPDRPKVNFLHTSFDFILEPDWIVDRLETADPHYIFTSTRATFEWMADMAARRPLRNRVCLIPGGYTRLDENLAHARRYTGPVDSLIYAPTLSLNAVQHHELTYSAPWAADILRGLADGFPDLRIIFRPHPNDLQLLRDGRDDELARPFLAALEFCAKDPRCVLDDSRTFYMDSYNRSRVMVSDTSSTAYTYALTTCRPVVFFSPRDDEVRALFSEASAFIRDREQVGQVAGSVAGMVSAVVEMLGRQDSWRDRVAAYRDRVCFNLGGTLEYFAGSIDYLLSGREHPDWTYFEPPAADRKD